MWMTDSVGWSVGQFKAPFPGIWLSGVPSNKIQAAPESYAQAPESLPLSRDLRQAFFKTRRGRRYRIVFEVNEQEVIILRVRGPAQAPLRRRDLPRE